MRGTIIAVYFLVSGLVSNGFGPVAVGLATDYLFKDNAAIGRSLSFVSFATGLPAAVLLISRLEVLPSEYRTRNMGRTGFDAGAGRINRCSLT